MEADQPCHDANNNQEEEHASEMQIEAADSDNDQEVNNIVEGGSQPD